MLEMTKNGDGKTDAALPGAKLFTVGAPGESCRPGSPPVNNFG